ncbi:hypothetical protein [Neomoorella thermoacetica]|uniref:hypothetical protein n=1 Tax=Neomoorella thermoacetica TaxID=1525 RepID=UPI0018C8A618|nr:hypothetical protein [Moorella thermoacetica]
MQQAAQLGGLSFEERRLLSGVFRLGVYLHGVNFNSTNTVCGNYDCPHDLFINELAATEYLQEKAIAMGRKQDGKMLDKEQFGPVYDFFATIAALELNANFFIFFFVLFFIVLFFFVLIVL